MSEYLKGSELNGLRGQQIFDDYAKVFGVSWDWQWTYAEVPSAQITVFPTEQRHEMAIPTRVFGKEDQWRYYFAHEMAHAAMAERIDPIFSTVYFSSKSEGSSAFGRLVGDIGLAQEVVDIWVDDLVEEKLGPRITGENRSSNMQMLVQAVKGDKEGNSKQLTMLMWAVTKADMERRGNREAARRVDQGYRAIRNIYGRKEASKALKLAEDIRDLPRLTGEVSADTKTFTGAAQMVMDALGMPWKAKIVKENGRHVWEVETK